MPVSNARSRLLSEASPDPDFVEELARDLLGYARPGDIVILDSPTRLSAG